MKTLPLVVLAYEGPLARAYLSVMRRAGVRPRAIVLMVMSHHPVTGKPVGRFFPGALRLGFAQKHQELTNNHWPQRIRQKHPALVEGLKRELESMMEGAGEVLDEISGAFDYASYGEELERILVRDLKDGEVAGALARRSPATVLYTGGGIVPKSLLGVEGIDLLHVHPGFLPLVRGADGLLWSLLVRGRPGASCFYMAAGIDTGRLVAAKDFAALRLKLPGEDRPDGETLYRVVFSFIDPILRAALFSQEVLPRIEGLTPESVPEQDASRGVTYHFLHDTVRDAALAKVFPA